MRETFLQINSTIPQRIRVSFPTGRILSRILQTNYRILLLIKFNNHYEHVRMEEAGVLPSATSGVSLHTNTETEPFKNITVTGSRSFNSIQE
jgi:hypothetical protein